MSGFRFVTAGESHGPALTVIVSGVPAGLQLDRARMNRELERRQQGYGRGGRMKIEKDEIVVTAGVRGGETLGSPIAISIPNLDHESWQGTMGVWAIDVADAEARRMRSPRPGHADLVGGIKYGRHDLRDILERASARETASRVAAGAVARELLLAFGIEIRSCVVSVGGAGDPQRLVSWTDLVSVDDASPLRAIDAATESAMIEMVDRARADGETLGGTIVAIARGVPIGLGSYAQWDTKLDGRIAQAIMSVHAVKGVAIGDGIAAASRPGSEVHDAIFFEKDAGWSRRTNRAGGLEGGVTNGEDLVVRAFMKPISTLRKGLPSVDVDTREPERSQWERSDITAVPACGVVCESMLAIALADAMREKFGGDSMGEMTRNWRGYVEGARAY